MLTSPDEIVADTGWEDLKITVEGRQTNPASYDDLAKYLSKATMKKPSSGYHSVWTAARDASGRLNLTWNISDGIPSLSVGDEIITNRRMSFRNLRSFLRKLKTGVLKDHKRQGSTFTCYFADKASTHFHRNGDYLRFTDWRWIHNARLKASS